jgi:hypothetical protein
MVEARMGIKRNKLQVWDRSASSSANVKEAIGIHLTNHLN